MNQKYSAIMNIPIVLIVLCRYCLTSIINILCTTIQEIFTFFSNTSRREKSILIKSDLTLVCIVITLVYYHFYFIAFLNSCAVVYAINMYNNYLIRLDYTVIKLVFLLEKNETLTHN